MQRRIARQYLNTLSFFNFAVIGYRILSSLSKIKKKIKMFLGFNVRLNSVIIARPEEIRQL